MGYGASPYGAPAPHPGGAPAPGAAPGLPQGWEQITDPASGRPYFCNRATGETSWTPPAGAPAPAPGHAPAPAPAPVPALPASAGGALPPGWEASTDPAS